MFERLKVNANEDQSKFDCNTSTYKYNVRDPESEYASVAVPNSTNFNVIKYSKKYGGSMPDPADPKKMVLYHQASLCKDVLNSSEMTSKRGGQFHSKVCNNWQPYKNQVKGYYIPSKNKPGLPRKNARDSEFVLYNTLCTLPPKYVEIDEKNEFEKYIDTIFDSITGSSTVKSCNPVQADVTNPNPTSKILKSNINNQPKATTEDIYDMAPPTTQGHMNPITDGEISNTTGLSKIPNIEMIQNKDTYLEKTPHYNFETGFI